MTIRVRCFTDTDGITHILDKIDSVARVRVITATRGPNAASTAANEEWQGLGKT